ncbi:alpha/beta hydrolase [Frigoribacterium sp. 2-23]|uniref:alpha/beta hydrolase n=1 Tax=Frigoribacterium sp. 2-23 TaxID=3415006 RepID=UPI003C6F9473
MSQRTGSRHRPDTPEARPGHRARRVALIVLAVVVAVVLIAAGVFYAWTRQTFTATPASLAAVSADPAVAISGDDDTVVLRPATTTPLDQGLVFVAGARVDPRAYEQTFAGLVATGVTVIVERPTLGLGIADNRPLSDFTSLVPDITNWAVGGHSLGGVRACQYAKDDPRVDALVLLGSYCATDVSARDDLAALSVGGSDDGLSTPQKIDDARHLLPDDTTFVQVDGLSHAQFGHYGAQPGDGTPTLSDADATARITTELSSFFAGLAD